MIFFGSNEERKSENVSKLVHDPCRIVLRKLPADMDYDRFVEKIASLKGVKSYYFVQGKVSCDLNESPVHSRAYLHMASAEHSKSVIRQLRNSIQSVDFAFANSDIQRALNESVPAPFIPGHRKSRTKLEQSPLFQNYLKMASSEITEEEFLGPYLTKAKRKKAPKEGRSSSAGKRNEATEKKKDANPNSQYKIIEATIKWLQEYKALAVSSRPRLTEFLDPKFVNEVVECIIGERPIETSSIDDNTQYFKVLTEFLADMFIGTEVVESHLQAMDSSLLDRYVKGETKCEFVEDLALTEAIYHYCCLLLVSSVRGKRMAWAMTNINYLPLEYKKVLEKFSLIADKRSEFEGFEENSEDAELEEALLEKEEQARFLQSQLNELHETSQLKEQQLLTELESKEEKLKAYDQLVAKLKIQNEQFHHNLVDASVNSTLNKDSRLEMISFENKVLEHFLSILAKAAD
ncbi:hypothetical protein KL930_003465 [Ogataea haglerorum]|uniref:UPF3 domain-containing protein n=1 Tax=Ogataea haglerorum TaxID=1937702 RepID=A0AAN6I188_9ASCO|nr:uncharacterized protein KL911_003057 [Ogataea haglerorum]KAG7695468.1 hypothetical protein KL915_002858 [Ogataea haglerorum]KAG7695797.1 hypothetical protein KL951_003322 [Ogataea haglerorum]KAG7705779.1 hypothetical protein KL914_003617 [Ogataea haglerorum]KAG7707203.1 hypothetical protein KL950_002863 [Ogataea haglerorum]KAG7718503.1 hypothetical protein KL913_002498 [Ogataea haglerorum]